jgi:hypothetical protein
MGEEQMQEWEDHPCSDVGVDNGEDMRDNTFMLMGQAPNGWNEESYRVANQVVSWARQHQDDLEDDAVSGGRGTCPSPLAVHMLNRGINPFDEFPSGNPTFEEHGGGEETSSGEPGLVYDDDGQPMELTFGVSTLHESIQDGFNQYGVRKNYQDDELVSVDAVYEAMEPGEPEDRNGVRITEEFLKRVASKDYSDRPPHLMDHRRDTLSHIGFVQDVWFSEKRGKLMVKARTYNTGADTHDEIVKRLTHEPPALSDGSLGFGQSYEAIENEDGERELVDGKIQEFSTTPFPGGYDEGGLRVAGQAD